MKNSKDIVAGASSQRALGLCPNCRAPIIAGNKFCMECGTKLEGVISTKEPLAPGSTSSPSNIAVSSSATSSQQLPLRASRSGQSPVADMLAHYQVSQSLREMYFDLGIALSQHQEYARANEAFQQALVESGVRPETVDILFYLAYVSELGGQR